MKKLTILFICAAFLGFFSCASKPEPQLESDITSSENKEAVIEENAEPITEPEVLEDKTESLEEINEPDVAELPPEDDEIEDVTDAENEEDLSESADDTMSQEGGDTDEAADDNSNDESDDSSDESLTEESDDETNASENEDKEENLDSEEAEESNNSEENAEESSEDDLEIDENEEAAENIETFPVSRSVSLKVSEYLDISYPGNGWIYMGATDNSKNITYFGRKLGTQNTNFSLQARLPGTKILHFYKNDNLTNQIIDDYIEVTVLEERGSSQTHIEAPEYKMPVKAKRPAVKALPASEENQDFPETDNQTDEVISLVAEETKKPAQKAKTAGQKPEAALATRSQSPVATVSEQTDSAPQTKEVSEADLKNLLTNAQNKFTQKDYKSALNSINEYLTNSKDKRDEALFLQGQILEAKSDVQDIAKAIDSYTTLTKNYPASKYWDKANKRIIYLKRFYLQGR